MDGPLYRWSGEYFGFFRSGCFFRADSEYLGWVSDDGRVWQADGTFLGELVDQNYVLRRRSMAEPARRARRARPARPARPARKANRAGRARRSSWDDALDAFSSA